MTPTTRSLCSIRFVQSGECGDDRSEQRQHYHCRWRRPAERNAVHESLHQIPMGGWNSRGIMPEPRFGFAFDLFGTHKTMLRGGFGMTHDRTQGNLIFNTVFNNPALVQTATVGSGNITDLPTLQSSFGNAALSNVLGASRDGKVPTVYSFSFGRSA